MFMTLQSFQWTLHCESHKSLFLSHLLHCGSQRSKYCNQISLVDKMREKLHILTRDMMQCPINEDGGWEHCIPYFPLRHSIKHKTDKKEPLTKKSSQDQHSNLTLICECQFCTKDSPDYFCLWICSTVTFF